LVVCNRVVEAGRRDLRYALENFEDKVRSLVLAAKVRISEHGYDELADDGFTAREVIAGISECILLEEYPEFGKGHCALFLQEDSSGKPIHVVWGIPKGLAEPAVLITAYRPDPGRWDHAYRRRLK